MTAGIVTAGIVTALIVYGPKQNCFAALTVVVGAVGDGVELTGRDRGFGRWRFTVGARSAGVVSVVTTTGGLCAAVSAGALPPPEVAVLPHPANSNDAIPTTTRGRTI